MGLADLENQGPSRDGGATLLSSHEIPFWGGEFSYQQYGNQCACWQLVRLENQIGY